MAQFPLIGRPTRVRRTVACMALLAGTALAFSGCDDGADDGHIVKAANDLRIAPALGIDNEGNDLTIDAYSRAASNAQGADNAAASLIVADATAAQAQSAFKRAADAWSEITRETASGQALLIRLTGEQSRLANLQSFDPGPIRAEISSRRTALQQELRAAESTRDEVRSEIASLEQSISELRNQARDRRDAAEELRERATAIGGTRRAVLIAEANERQREGDAFEREASELGLELDRAMFRSERTEQELAALRRQLETLMQRERTLEAQVSVRSQQATNARENAEELTGRIASQINTMAELYNAEIAPALADAIAGFESAASRARQGQNVLGSTARLSAGSSEHALANAHSTHAMMLDGMLSFVDLAVARGVASGTITEVRSELQAKLNEANAAANEAAAQAAGSLSGGGASGQAGEILNQVAESLNPSGGAGALPPEEDWQDDADENRDEDAERDDNPDAEMDGMDGE